MSSSRYAIGVLSGILSGAILAAPVHAKVIRIHTEGRGIESLVEINSDAENSSDQVADAVFQETDEWSKDSETGVDDGNKASPEAGDDELMVAGNDGFKDGRDPVGFESTSAVPLPASVWLLARISHRGA